MSSAWMHRRACDFGKDRQGVAEVLEAMVNALAAADGRADAPLKRLLVDSWYDAYLGVVSWSA